MNQANSLSDEQIQRAKEGLQAARNPRVKSAIQDNLEKVRLLGQGKKITHGNPHLRYWVMRSLIFSLFQVKIEGMENIPTQPAILAPNHLNHLDPFLLLAVVPPHPYYYILADARTLYNQWWKRLVLGFSGGVIPLERRWGEEISILAAATRQPQLQDLAAAISKNVPTGTELATLRQIERAVATIFRHRNGIILFPEGRLGAQEGNLALPLKRGIALYALRSGIPIVPVGIVGTKHLYLGKPLTVRFGEPLKVSPCQRPRREQVENLLAVLAEGLQNLLPDNYHEPDGLKLMSHFLNHLFY